MKKKIAINGFGRIGRGVLKNILKKYSDSLEVVAINDLADGETLSHLLKYDSVYGRYEKSISFKDGFLNIGSAEIKLFAEKDPEGLPWGDLGVDIVLECTGLFTNYESAKKHIEAGAKKVIISAPSKDPENIPSFLMGINEENYVDAKHHIVDMGSCTTNCLAPVLKILNDEYGVVSGMMTTIHSYTVSQNLLDSPHKDLRRARAGAVNMIPTTTGAAKAIGRVLPELEGKVSGMAVRVPTPTVSLVDLTCNLSRGVEKEDIEELFKKEEKKEKWSGIFKIEEEPLVSSDYIGDGHSSIVDSKMVYVQKESVKIIAWYDNEWGYSARLADFCEYMADKL